MAEQIKVTLENIQSGIIGQLSDTALEEIRRDFTDSMKDPHATRKMVLEVAFFPSDENPDIIGVAVKLQTKLAPIVASAGRVKLGHVHGELGFYQELLGPGDDRVIPISKA
jgi:hypothetical protein